MTESPPQGLRRALGKPAAAAIVIGSVLGSGIYFKPQLIANHLGDFWWIIAVWITGGVLCLLGALTVSELSAAMPRAGGFYVYLREAYGRLIAFLFGWGLFAIVRPASTGALAWALSATLAERIGFGSGTQFIIAVGAIALLAWVNIMGVVWGGFVQTLTTLIKVATVVILMVSPWLFGAIEPANFASSLQTGTATVSLDTFMLALLAVMFAYNSWHEVTPLAEEIREPQRNLPWALLFGVGLLIVLYVGANVAYHGVMSMEEVASRGDSGSAVAGVIFGTVGGDIMRVLVMCSVFGTLNANLMHAPRVYYAMGRDGVFFRGLGRVHTTRRTPVVAIASQAVLATALIVFATFRDKGVFDQLTDIVVFGSSVFYVLGVFSVFVLRRRRPDLERPYRTIGYPFTPALFVLGYAVFLPMIFLNEPLEASVGIGVILLGIPVFAWATRRGSLE